MKQAKTKFTWCAVAAVFVLLTVLLGIINGVNFTMASQDADRLTQEIAENHGAFGRNTGEAKGPRQFFPDQLPQEGQAQTVPAREGFGGMGPMGPNSPEMQASLRYFTAAFDKDGSGSLIAYQISAVDEAEAILWAEQLTKEGTGWTRGTYRYRVYKDGKQTLVTVIDQGRELLACYRILIISLIGEAVGLALSILVLHLVGKRLFAPLEEADRKQRQFIAQAERELKLPLTVISAEVEVLEREQGSTENTKAIRRQIRKLSGLVRRLGSITIFETERTDFSLSQVWQEALERNRDRFAARSLSLTAEIEENLRCTGSPEAMRQVAEELIENALSYGKTNAGFQLSGGDGRVRLRAVNDTDLPDGSVDQVFDRFTVLENAGPDKAGLGLAFVKEAAKAHNGRVSARVEGGSFRLELEL